MVTDVNIRCPVCEQLIVARIEHTHPLHLNVPQVVAISYQAHVPCIISDTNTMYTDDTMEEAGNRVYRTVFQFGS